MLDIALLVILPVLGLTQGGLLGGLTGFVSWLLITMNVKLIRTSRALGEASTIGFVVGAPLVLAGIVLGGWRWGWATGLGAQVFAAILANLITRIVKSVRRHPTVTSDPAAQAFVEELKREQPAPAVDWRPITVQVDFLPGVYAGYASSMQWGQFAWPQFPEAEARRVATDVVKAGGSCRYDPKLDSFFARGPQEKREVQVWGHQRSVGKLYDIGGGQWQWRYVTE